MEIKVSQEYLKISTISLSHLKLFTHSIASVQSIQFSRYILAYINLNNEMDLLKHIEGYH